MQEKFSAVEVGGKFLYTLKNQVAGIFATVFAINFRHVLFVAVAKDNAPVVSQAALLRRQSEMLRLNHFLVEQT